MRKSMNSFRYKTLERNNRKHFSIVELYIVIKQKKQIFSLIFSFPFDRKINTLQILEKSAKNTSDNEIYCKYDKYVIFNY